METRCPKCGSTYVYVKEEKWSFEDIVYKCKCRDCGHFWKVEL